MQRTLTVIAFIAATHFSLAQEQLPRAEALKVALYLGADLQQLEGTPIQTDVDLKYPVAVREGDYGAMVLPECKLSPEDLSKAGSKVVSLGQLWLRKLTPMKDGEGIPAQKLQLIKVQTENATETAVRCALGFKGNGQAGADLLIYGKSKEPLLKVSLKKLEGQTQAQAQEPIAISADRIEGDTAKVSLKILGRYEGAFRVASLPE